MYKRTETTEIIVPVEENKLLFRLCVILKRCEMRVRLYGCEPRLNCVMWHIT